MARKTHPHDRLVERFYYEMWNRFDKSLIPELLDSDFVFRGSLGTETYGWVQFAGYMDSIRSFSSDFRNEIVELIAADEKVFARMRYTGTHTGPLFGLQPTMRAFEYAGAAVFTVAADRLSSVWVLGDVDGLKRALASPGDDDVS